MPQIVGRPKRVLICGQRGYTNYQAIFDYLSVYGTGTVVIHGGAKGADSLAGKAAKMLFFKVEVYPAQWTTYGKAAGPIRNRRMLVEGKPDIVVAFYKKGGSVYSKGTNNMVSIAQKANVPVVIIEDIGEVPTPPRPKPVIGL